uniref:Uncharacterized protein n=1 Tax=Anguilla anguilla TaxID=7936 RepID=A0A0E9QTZ5_ANGAN
MFVFHVYIHYTIQIRYFPNISSLIEFQLVENIEVMELD